MIDALIAGRLHGAALQRTSKAGRPFVTAKMRAATHEGESLFVNLLAFADNAQAALLALNDGDAVAVSGSIKPTAWQDKDGNTRVGLDVIAAQVLTSYSIDKRRKAATGEHSPKPHGRPSHDAWIARTPGRQNHLDEGLDDGCPLSF